jgi:hypothetical protein
MMELSYRRHRFPSVVIQHAVWLYLRSTLPRRKAKTAASQRLPGRVKDGSLIMCFKSIEIIWSRGSEWMALSRILERL